MEKINNFFRPKVWFAFVVLVAGVAGMVFSWPVFLLILLTIFGVAVSWLFMLQILIFLPALLPFQPALNPAADIDLASGRLAITLLAIVGSIYIVYTRKSWFNLSTPTILIMFFLIWSLFSGVMADDVGRYIRKFFVFLTIFPIYFLLPAFLKKDKDWGKLFHYWSWSAFVVSLIGLGQFLFQFLGGQQLFFKFWGNYVAPILYGINAGEAIASNPSWFVNISGITVLRAIGTFPDPHMLAYFLGMSTPIQVAYVFECKNKYLWAFPILSFLVLLLTFSRGSYVGLAGVVFWLAYYVWKRYPEKRQRLAVGAILIFVLSSFLPPVRDRFASILDVYEGSNKGRLEIWDEAVVITLSNPVFGVGLGNYANTVRPESKYREPIYAHNTYLDLSSEIGFPGAIVWILIMLWGVYPLLSKEGYTEEKSLLKNYNFAAALGILWFALHCLFETPIFSPQILPLILVLIAYRAYYSDRTRFADQQS